MRLELLVHRIRDLRAGAPTRLGGGVLTVDTAALGEALRAAAGIEVRVELARPGESVRLSNVLDLIEPRCKDDAGGAYFAGFHAPLQVAGSGGTHVLEGLAVVETGALRGLIGGVIDLSGAAARLTPFGSLHHVVLETAPRAGMDKTSYAAAIRRAGLEAACLLARACRSAAPDERRTYDLSLTAEGSASSLPAAGADGAPRLPRIAYVCMLHALGDTRESYLYGQRVRDFTPTLLHPNEVLDGAVVSHHYDISPGMKNTTYTFQNHPVIRDLYARHGRDLIFAGVVAANQPVRLEDKECSAFMTARLSAHLLRADGVIITKEGAGAGDYDLMRQCQAHEAMGVRTVLIDNEQINASGIGEMPLIDVTPYAEAMVSTGNVEELVHLPEVARVLGGDTMVNVPGSLRGPLRLESIVIPGANSTLGLTSMATAHV
ncbi:MAG: beta-aspartyl-peptidase [Candidatus Tectomicrobia bacterium]|nr:beta-aspartyl-peptidase [Candidatus Tectomicrobia bacterium]